MVVVGAGIVGAAVAYETARKGADVVLVDRALPASGVTAASFAWIGGARPGQAPDASTPLRERVLADYRRLEREVPGVRVGWRGALLWGDGPLTAEGPDERIVDEAGLRRLEPRLRARPARALHLTSHAAVDPVAVTRALVRAAQTHGARLLTGTAVTAVDAGGVQSSAGRLPADTVVVAAGTGTPQLCPGLPVEASPAVLMRFAAPPRVVRTLVATPELEVRQAAEGELLVATVPGVGGAEMLRRLTAAFDARHVRLVEERLGQRPMPADGLPVIGPGPRGAYVAVMHSGITLGPSAARLIAAELVDGVEAPELAGLRPARFRGRDTRVPGES
ncbi:NAD(P)/FAD-dependent oxidoreductase [Actinoplanes sp. URMC 104]|uniref:NAD(P)/FAD-dependent oxidoreductase n=1 Tax=Actinoplanes sp. URMC 104 TaxID=3423409 RepID=UPI003F1C8C9B